MAPKGSTYFFIRKKNESCLYVVVKYYPVFVGQDYCGNSLIMWTRKLWRDY